ncbi:MAG: aminopeptidase [Clostridia bacterium]|nr:aminopeptidase [Clostridia bacterium]
MKKQIEKYADLLVKVGINLQKGQTLVITTPVECAEFARLVTKKAYETGAREVVVRWLDELTDKMRYEMAEDAVFDEFPQGEVAILNDLADRDAAFLRISASDPELMKDVNPKRISRQNKVRNRALEHYMDRLMSDQNVWCVASIPTESWAKKVFPGAEDAVEQLWDAIFKSVRVDQENPVQAWRNHQEALKTRVDFLNEGKFDKLRYKNSLGTDLVVELPEGHFWAGGGTESKKGYEFIANMPTEEVFTLPKRDGVNGTIVSSLPLNYNGSLIENFSFTFVDGIVMEFTAEKGFDTLKEMLETDDGACRLGEVALVPYDSPISNQKILFFNTLFDENASCHFALGKAYPMMEGVEDMSKEEMLAAGVNDSLIHVDFMVGTKDMEITGIKKDGSEVPIFRTGNFV